MNINRIAAALCAALLLPPVGAQTAANGPYYATPSWDQKLPASTRFLVLANWNSEAVLDRETGLVWQRTPVAFDSPPYEVAVQLCAQATSGGRYGWRLPALEEILTLADPTIVSINFVSALPPGHPFVGVPPGVLYWTGTTRIEHPGTAWVVGIDAGGAPSGQPGRCCSLGPSMPKTSTSVQRAWCVRGAAATPFN
jgi:hypothetical protein